MKIQASPTSRATTRLMVTHGWRIWCSDPAGLDERGKNIKYGTQAECQTIANPKDAHHNVEFRDEYRLILSLVIC